LSTIGRTYRAAESQSDESTELTAIYDSFGSTIEPTIKQTEHTADLETVGSAVITTEYRAIEPAI